MDLTKLTAVEAAAGIRRGDFTSEALVVACLKRIAEREPDVAGVGASRRGVCAGPGACGGRGASRSGHARARCTACPSASRTSSTRPSCRRRTARASSPGGARATDASVVAPAQGGGRRHPRQDGDDGARVLRAGQDAQPAQSRAHAGGLVVGLGGGGRRLPGAARARARRRRARSCRPASYCGVHRLEADVRCHLAHGRARAVAAARHDRRVRALGRGCRAHHRLHGGSRPARRRHGAAAPGLAARSIAR